MRFKLSFLAFAGAAVLAASGGGPLLSLDPIVTEQEATFDPGLLGVWAEDHGKDLLIIRQNGGSAYRITLVSGSTALEFEARLFRVGEARWLDLLPPADALRIPAHFLVRVWTEGASLRTGILGSEWPGEEASQQLASRPLRSAMLLTAPGAAIRGFLMKHEPDETAYCDLTTFQRLQ
jgi:hypothetical protein